MDKTSSIKRNMVQIFGDAYHAFGLNRLLGHVVATLMIAPEPLSLDQICKELRKSKGPVSQIARRLADHNLLKRVWVPGSRKDYYELHPDAFSNAFRHNFRLIRNNTKISKQIKDEVNQTKDAKFKALHSRLIEMERFYELMEKHYQAFIDEWEKEKNRLSRV
jgi:DNA-binding transcriptional regulator GbsR (MarR family)